MIAKGNLPVMKKILLCPLNVTVDCIYLQGKKAQYISQGGTSILHKSFGIIHSLRADCDSSRSLRFYYQTQDTPSPAENLNLATQYCLLFNLKSIARFYNKHNIFYHKLANGIKIWI